MADDDVAAAELRQHRCRNFARVRALRVLAHVLSAQGNRCSVQPFGGLLQIGKGTHTATLGGVLLESASRSAALLARLPCIFQFPATSRTAPFPGFHLTPSSKSPPASPPAGVPSSPSFFPRPPRRGDQQGRAHAAAGAHALRSRTGRGAPRSAFQTARGHSTRAQRRGCRATAAATSFPAASSNRSMRRRRIGSTSS